MPTPSVGNMNAPSSPCSSITARRAAGSRYAGEIGSRAPNIDLMSLASGLRPRKYSSRLPGRATGSNVGFGMKRLTLPPTSSRCFPLSSAHCMQRLCIAGSTWRMNASVAS